MYSRGTLISLMSFIQMSGLLSKVYFPREILPISANITAFLMMAFDLCAFAVFIAIFHFVPTWTIVYLPLLLVILFILTLGISFALSVGNVYFRDLEHIWEIALQAGYFLAPIFLTVDFFPPYLRNLILLNPIALIIDMAHKVTLYNTIPSLHDFGYLLVASFAVLGIGYAIFKKFESKAIELL
jgi:lipopolysaccharide transport system permease protein